MAGSTAPGWRQSGSQDTGNRIDNRARGNAAQLLEKYKTLARDAQMQGDRVNTEYYLQFADHYFRVLAESRRALRGAEPERRASAPRPAEDSFDDVDGDEEMAPRAQRRLTSAASSARSARPNRSSHPP